MSLNIELSNLKGKVSFSRLATKPVMALLISLVLFIQESKATHFRYGNVTWSYVNDSTVTFHITQAWRRSFAWNTTPLVGGLPVFTGNFFFGDSTQAPMNVNVTAVNLAENWFYGVANITHTYSGTGPRTAFFGSCCRISSLQNNFDGNFRVETIVDLSEGNYSPISTLQPIVNLSTGLSAATFTIPATDPNRDTLVFSLSSPTEMGDVTLTQPAGLTIDSSTGVVTWNTIGRTVGEMWNASVRISDGHGGITTLDFLIQIVAQSSPPYFNYAVTPVNGHVYEIQPGTNLTFAVEALDSDFGDTVTLQAFGLPLGATMSPGLPLNGNPVQSVFSWTPTLAQIRSRIVSFMAQDLSGNQTSTYVTINVSQNPVFDPPTPPKGSGFCIPTGVLYSTIIQAHAPDSLMALQITSATIPVGATLTPPLPTPAGNTTFTQLDWTPSPSDWGPNQFSFTATDVLGHSTTTNFSLVANTSTVFSSLPPVLVINENQPFVYNITVTDPDVPFGDELAILAITLPAWLTLTDNGNGTATLSGTPGTGSAGVYPVHIDGEDIYHHCLGHAEQMFSITVIPCILQTTISAKPATAISYCQGQQIWLTAGSGSSYNWSTGETTQTINVIAIGSIAYSVTVGSGNCSATASYTVVAAPNQPPRAFCRNVIAYLDVSGSVSISAAEVDRGSRDNCSSITLAVSPAAFNCSNTGANSVTLTVTDTSGLSAFCTSIVTVIDSIIPAAICRDATVYLDITGNAVISASDVDGGSSDNCSSVRSVSPVAFSCANTGANNVMLTVTDASGLSGTCTSVVTVIDNTAPMAICRNATVNLDVTGNATISAADIDGGSTDNCPFVRSASPSSFSCSNVGTNTATLTVTGNNGLSSSCNATVTVLGQTASCSVSSSVSTIYLGYGPQSTLLSTNIIGALAYSWSPSAGLSCSNCPSPVFIPTAEGNYTFTVTVSNSSGCNSTCTVTICVLDIRVPGTDGQKIYLCHVLPNNLGGSQTLAMSVNAVSAHYPGHIDDRLGRCDQYCASAKTDEAEYGDLNNNDSEVRLYPNPFNERFQIAIENQNTKTIDVRIFDIAGKLIAEYPNKQVNDGLIYGGKLSKGAYLVEVKQVGHRDVFRIIKAD